MIPNKNALIDKIAEKCDIRPKIRLKDFAQPLTDGLVGRSFEFIYEDDDGVVEDIFGIRFLDEMTLEWRGVEGPLEGHRQSEAYMAFDVAEDIYFLTWYEQASTRWPVENGKMRVT